MGGAITFPRVCGWSEDRIGIQRFMIVQAGVYLQRRRLTRRELQNGGENFTAFSVWLVWPKPERLAAAVLKLLQCE
jgi:hypothetical protein